MKSFRHTRITFTIGPATESEAQLEAIINAGANVVRLNMAHADHAWVRATVERVRKVSLRMKKELGVMMDIKGPEIRTGSRKEATQLTVGQLVDVTGSDTALADGEILVIPTNYPKMISAVPVGGVVLVDNGLIQLRVLEQKKDRLRCKVEQPGPLGSRRHINLPGVKVDLPALTDKDRADVAVGCEVGVDFYALSFVREAADVYALRTLLAQHESKAHIISKIEDQSAIEHLGSILEATDVIVATHMLESMIQNPVPTRAEVTDVSNAVLEMADSVMLSGETTTGKHPIRCVEVMKRIAKTTENELPRVLSPEQPNETPKIKLLRAAAGLAQDLGHTGIIAFTRNGDVPRTLSSLRTVGCPIYAFMEEEHVHRKMSLLWGVESFQMKFEPKAEDNITLALIRLRDEGYCVPGQMLVIVTNVILGPTVIDSVQLRSVPPIEAPKA
ncbi:MAG: pyruvate kinase [Verrucomicrobia bacterium]|nr:pyruvate kinase [Verrucomicrobiota bacterium]